MEANEQGLTTEERIMFAVLGIILVIAIGVLTVNYFSTHERVEGTSTAETERDNQEDDEKNTPSKDSLKETTNDHSKITFKGIPKVIKTKSTNSKSKNSTSPKNLSNQIEEDDEDNNGQGSTSPEEGEIDDGGVVKYEDELDWTFNTNIVKESYANEIIKVPNTVKLTDDSEKEAEVKIVNSKTGEEIVIENGEVSLPSGEYKYIYKCNGFTKELPLVVYNRLENVDIEIIKENDLLKEIDETNHDNLYYLINHSSISQDKNDYKLTIHRINNYNLVILKAKLPFAFKNITTDTKGISLYNNKQTYNLAENEFIIHLDLNQMSLSKTNKVFLKIDDIEYLFNFDISITNDTVEEKAEEEQQEDQKMEDSEEKENQNEVEDPKEEDNEEQDTSKEEQKEENKEEENKTSEEEEQKENPSEVKDPEEEKDSEDNDTEEKQKPSEDSKEEQKEVEKDPDPTPEDDEPTNSSDNGLNNTETSTAEQETVEEIDISPTT